MADMENQILTREQALRAWFTQNANPVLAQIDGLDIGWGGVQRWATAHMPNLGDGLHLDLACGYGTFLAQLGWRFPTIRLVGLNIDFSGPHASARPLLTEAGVGVILVQADARRMPFGQDSFDSASCFLGLQDIGIGFGERGIREAVIEAIRALRPGGILVLIDEYPFDRFDEFLNGLPTTVIDQGERRLDIHWERDVAMTAIRLYAEGWVAQMRLLEDDTEIHGRVIRDTLARMEADVESQISKQGYYVPFGPMRMVICRKEV
ncbi:MAG: class I SAM-dependent methyltransferase [Anaerolineales bacterium]|nr:class I SAM-dependent methyltransferase [Anaerolineales bacterium]